MTRESASGPGVSEARWLTTTEGVEAVSRATASLDENPDTLKLGTDLRTTGMRVARAIATVDAAQARLRARERWPDADDLLFTTGALEQASDPAVSRWRARRYTHAPRILDLCAGVGGDALALAAHAPTLAVDCSHARMHLLRHNADVRHAPVDPVVGDALSVPAVTTGLAVHADPSRRRGSRRVRAPGAMRPPVPALLDHLGGEPDGIGIVVSPAVPLEDPDMPSQAEIEFIQLGGDLTEAMLWLGGLRRPVAATATLLPQGISRSRAGPRRQLPVADVGAWLLEVAPAAVRARLHDELGGEIGAWRVATRRALLSTDAEPPASPWWTRWAVEAVLPPRPRPVARWLARAPAMPLEITTHGVDADPEEWVRTLGSPPRGPHGRRLHLVRTDDAAVAVATRPPG